MRKTSKEKAMNNPIKKTKEEGLVPELRFPEFISSGRWNTKTLNKLAKRVTQKNKESNVKRVLTNSAQYGIVDQRDFFDKDIANKNNLEGYYIVDKGDYVYNPRISNYAPVGPISKNSIAKGVMSPLYTVFRFNSLQNGFYEQYFKSTHWFQYLRALSNSGARHDRMSISNEDFEKMPIPESPLIEEQQKIANCLFSLDDLVNAHSKKLDFLKAHKKGLMQQLFPAEDETIPKLRFPEFKKLGDWQKISLDKLGELVSGLTYSPDDVRDRGLLVLRSSNVKNGEVKLEDNVYVTPNIKGANLTKPNDILICVRNGSKTLIGKNALIPDNMPLCTHGAFMTIFRTSSAKFVFQLFQSTAYKKQVDADLGATINSINGKQFIKYTFYVPCSDEQKKIAKSLFSLDKLISAQSQKIELLKSHKKGLMQQLFPAVNEIGA